MRIEDIDIERCNSAFENSILEDLSWLKLKWPQPVRKQSNHMADYTKGLENSTISAFFIAVLSRKELAEVCPLPRKRCCKKPSSPRNTLRYISTRENERRLEKGAPYAIRLRMEAASSLAGKLKWFDTKYGEQSAEPEIFGDIVLARKDIATSYHLSVTIDDAVQGVTRVTRGDDLFRSPIFIIASSLLELPTPDYHHHKIITDEMA